MLGLKLRAEFLSDEMRNTAIVFRRGDNTGALEIPPDDFFKITYPSIDLQTALNAISTQGRPIILLGRYGRGKSHIMAALHHALKAPAAVEKWVSDWVNEAPGLKDLQIPQGYELITATLNDHYHEYLWDILFEEHKRGEFFSGRFRQMERDVPPKELIIEMLKEQPVALLLDELQTWYDGTRDRPGISEKKLRTWAFSFIQTLSEIANEFPELLILIVSLRDTKTEAFDQLQRNNPILIDFLAPPARLDRQRLMLHRLFENRRFIHPSKIHTATADYRQERFRLLRSSQDAGSLETSDQQVIDAWPFSPELLEVLEDQILPSSKAQGLRTLLVILAQIYRDRSTQLSLFTPADFAIDDEKISAVQSLIDAITTPGQTSLYDTAVRNLDAVRQAGIAPAYLRDIMGSLWMRSFSPENRKGATAQQLHVDITHAYRIDDNEFIDQLEQIVAHSFNIHFDNIGGEKRYFFKDEENPRSRLLASAHNDSLFTNFKDKVRIRKALHMELSPANVASDARIIVLGQNWQTDPWSEVDEAERAERWERPEYRGRPVLLVLPFAPPSANLHSDLGTWLAKFVPHRRNAVRFLLPKDGTRSLYLDPEVYINARAALLAEEWGKQYKSLGGDFHKRFRETLEKRFDRYAVLRSWNYQEPAACEFIMNQVRGKVSEIARDIDKKLREDYFELEAFEALVTRLARESKDVEALLKELHNPPGSPLVDAIVYLGEKEIAEQLVLLVQANKLALKVNGFWVQYEDGSERDKQRIRRLAFKQGQELAEMMMDLPHRVGMSASGTTPAQPAPPPPDRSQSQNSDVVSKQQPVEPLGVGLWENIDLNLNNHSPLTPSKPVFSHNVAENSATYATSQSSTMSPSAHSAPRKRRSEPKPRLSLVAQLEQWGLAADQAIPVARLEFTSISVATLKRVLQNLPPDLRSILEVELDEGQDARI